MMPVTVTESLRLAGHGAAWINRPRHQDSRPGRVPPNKGLALVTVIYNPIQSITYHAAVII
jgi:hypothetical protein